MRAASRRVLNELEEAQIRFALRLGNVERGIKKGLQELCTLYEAGRYLRDPTDVRQQIHSHLNSQAILLRRWALKALGLIGHPDDTSRIVERLRVETDVEAQTWGAAALLKNADDRGVKDVCAEANMERTTALALAARLYAPDRWLKLHPEPIVVSLNDDDLTLKWAIFLVGYDRAPDAMFHAKHENPIFLGELNNHPTPEISEYSVWAMWERDDFGVADLKIALEEVDKHPDSVRKWLYRLMLKAPALTGLDPGAVDHLRRKERDISAREGLALGLIGDVGLNFNSVLLDWYHTEADPGIKETLLVGMARRSSGNPDFEELVRATFVHEQPGGAVRKRLLAATAQSPMNLTLKKIEADDELRRQGLLEFYSPGIAIFGGNNDMSSNKTTFTAGRDMTGQVMAGGDVVGSANSAVQNLDQSRSADQKILSDVLALIAQLNLQGDEASSVAEAVKVVAEDPKPENKGKLLSVVKALGKGTIYAVTHAPAIAEAVSAISDWI